MQGELSVKLTEGLFFYRIKEKHFLDKGINNPSVSANAEPPPFAQGRLFFLRACTKAHERTRSSSEACFYTVVKTAESDAQTGNR